MLSRLDVRVQRNLSDCAIQTLAIGFVQVRIDAAKVIAVPKESALKLSLSAILKLNAPIVRNSGNEKGLPCLATHECH
jgi:hypothetical protein